MDVILIENNTPNKPPKKVPIKPITKPIETKIFIKLLKYDGYILYYSKFIFFMKTFLLIIFNMTK